MPWMDLEKGHLVCANSIPSVLSTSALSVPGDAKRAHHPGFAEVAGQGSLMQRALGTQSCTERLQLGLRFAKHF